MALSGAMVLLGLDGSGELVDAQLRKWQGIVLFLKIRVDLT